MGVYASGMVLVTSLCCLAGLAMYAVYATCDPVAQGRLQFRDGVSSLLCVNIITVLNLSCFSLCSGAVTLQIGKLFPSFTLKNIVSLCIEQSIHGVFTCSCTGCMSRFPVKLYSYAGAIKQLISFSRVFRSL